MKDLAILLVNSGPLGIVNVINKFVEEHPNAKKSHTERSIATIAVKEKRGGDKRPCWYLIDSYKHFVEGLDKETSTKRSLESQKSSNKRQKTEQTPEKADQVKENVKIFLFV